VLQVGVQTRLTKKQQLAADKKKKDLEEARQRAAKREEINPFVDIEVEGEEDDSVDDNDETKPEEESAPQARAQQALEIEEDDSVDDNDETEPEEESAPQIKNPKVAETYQSLNVLSNTIANHAKGILYSRLKKSFANPNVSYSLHKLSSSPSVLAENNGLPYNDYQCAHQFIRSFLHMHDEQLHAVIIAYMRLHYGIISEADAFNALIFSLQREITMYYNFSEAWDIALLRESLMHYKIQYDEPYKTLKRVKQHVVLMALHHGLKELGLYIVWIEWIANWKNMMKLLYAQHSPLNLHEPQTIECFSQKKMDNLFAMRYFKEPVSFPSINQCVSYCAEQMFGCQLRKDTDNRWVLDNPLEPTHELNLTLKTPHPRFGFAQIINKSDYKVMKKGRLWMLKENKMPLFDAFLDPPQRLGSNFNAQYLIMLDCDQFLVKYDPDVHKVVLRSQKITEYSEEVNIEPVWNKKKRRMDTKRIEKHKFLHVGPNIQVVAKRIWFTRDIWHDKLLNLRKIIQEDPHKANTEFYDPGHAQTHESYHKPLLEKLQDLEFEANFSDPDPESDPYTLEEICATIVKYATWIEFCRTFPWWDASGTGTPTHQDANKFAFRLARIVYQLFTVHQIWTVIERHLLNDAKTSVYELNSNSTYTSPSPSRDLTVDTVCEYFQETFEKMNTNILNSLDDDHKTSVMMNYLVRKWLYEIEDIGPHPLKYKTKREKLDDEMKNTITLLKNILKKHWTKEQNFYGGAKSSFTYIWNCPSSPETLESDDPKHVRKHKHHVQQSTNKVVLHNKVMTLTAHMGISEKFISDITENIVGSNQNMENLKNLIDKIEVAKTKLLSAKTLEVQNYAFDIHEMKTQSAKEWVQYENKIESVEIANDFFSCFSSWFAQEDFGDWVDVMQGFKNDNFNLLTSVYNPSQTGTHNLEKYAWFHNNDNIKNSTSTVETYDVTTHMPFTLQTHGFLPVQKNKVVYFADAELAGYENIWAQVEFRFKYVQVPADGDCFYHSVYKSHNVITTHELRRLAADALLEKCNKNCILSNAGGFTIKYKQEVEDIIAGNNVYKTIADYIKALKIPNEIWADNLIIQVMPDIIHRPIIVYSRKRGVPPVQTGLIRFLEKNEIGSADQRLQLKACKTIIDFMKVFEGIKTHRISHEPDAQRLRETVEDDLLDIKHQSPVQIQAIIWSETWIAQKKIEWNNIGPWDKAQLHRDRYRPLWKYRELTTEADASVVIQDEIGLAEQQKRSDEFYGNLSEDEARESKKWWPDFFTQSNIQKDINEILTQEVTQLGIYTPSTPYTEFEPVRVLYNGQNHYEALVFSSVSKKDTRMEWLRKELGVWANIVHEQGVGAHQQEPQVEPPDIKAEDAEPAPDIKVEDTEPIPDIEAENDAEPHTEDNGTSEGTYKTEYTCEFFDVEVSRTFEIPQMKVLDQKAIEHVAKLAPFDEVRPKTRLDVWADLDDEPMDFNIPPSDFAPPNNWTQSQIHLIEQRSKRIFQLKDDFDHRVVNWNKPSKANAKMSRAKFFLYLLYSDIQSLVNMQTFEFIKDHVDAIKRHEMNRIYGLITTETKKNNQAMSKADQAKLNEFEELLQWSGDNLLQQYFSNHKQQVLEILHELKVSKSSNSHSQTKYVIAQESSPESEETSDTQDSKTETEETSGTQDKRFSKQSALSQNKKTKDPENLNNDVVLTQQDVDKAIDILKKKYQDEIQKQKNTRDVKKKEQEEADNNGKGFAEGSGETFEFVPSPRQKNRGHGGTNGEKDGTDRNNREHGRLNKTIEAGNRSAEGRNGQSENRPRSFMSDMTNIYLVHFTNTPAACTSVGRVPALALPLRPAHETRLALDYNSGGCNYDAGSSCAKYAV
jgi:hypothetical protein